MANEISNNWSQYGGTLLQSSQGRHQRAGDRSLKLIKEVDNSLEEEDSQFVANQITFRVDEWRKNIGSESGESTK